MPSVTIPICHRLDHEKDNRKTDKLVLKDHGGVVALVSNKYCCI